MILYAEMNGHQANAWEYPATPENVARLQLVVKDLEVVHDYHSTNTERLQAQSVLPRPCTFFVDGALCCVLGVSGQCLIRSDLIRSGTIRVAGDWRLPWRPKEITSLIRYDILASVF